MPRLQASYAAPLILLAQNRQADRDRVSLEQDRSRDERNLADTEFLAREVAALRIALRRGRDPRLPALASCATCSTSSRSAGLVLVRREELEAADDASAGRAASAADEGTGAPT